MLSRVGVVVLALMASTAQGVWASEQVIILTPDRSFRAGQADLRTSRATRYEPGLEGADGIYFENELLQLPGDPVIDALHKMPDSDTWLFSIEGKPNDFGKLEPLGGNFSGSPLARPNDVILFDRQAGNYDFFFCGRFLGIDAGVDVDAVILETDGTLMLSVDVPTIIAGQRVKAADLVSFAPNQNPVPPCVQWTFQGVVFDASAFGGIQDQWNLIGASRSAGGVVLAFDGNAEAAPKEGRFPPGRIAEWNGMPGEAAFFSPFANLSSWEFETAVNALTLADDNCPDDSNPDQADADSDGVGDDCDNCPMDFNPDQTDVCGCPPDPDSDGDGVGDACDPCPDVPNESATDTDGDQVPDDCDNCPDMSNTEQTNSDNDTYGDACDNCPLDDNEDQSDIDLDDVGDVCDDVCSPIEGMIADTQVFWCASIEIGVLTVQPTADVTFHADQSIRAGNGLRIQSGAAARFGLTTVPARVAVDPSEQPISKGTERAPEEKPGAARSRTDATSPSADRKANEGRQR